VGIRGVSNFVLEGRGGAFTFSIGKRRKEREDNRKDGRIWFFCTENKKRKKKKEKNF